VSDHIIELAKQYRLPVIYQSGEYTQAAGLLSYSPSLPAVFRRAADYVDKVLRGARPAELPVEQPSTFELVVNRTTAQTLGISIPADIAAQVTDWVQ
jgi:putative ABC transport system substrate-binding protein